MREDIYEYFLCVDNTNVVSDAEKYIFKLDKEFKTLRELGAFLQNLQGGKKLILRAVVGKAPRTLNASMLWVYFDDKNKVLNMSNSLSFVENDLRNMLE